MADKADDIRQEIRRHRQDIAESRSAISEKLTILEDRVQEAVDGVKHTFDVRYQVKRRPWLMFSVSLLAGYALGRRGAAPCTTTGTVNARSAQAQPQSSVASEVKSHVKDELAAIKGAAVGAVISTLWAMAKQVLLPAAGSAVTKADSQPIDRPEFNCQIIASKTKGRQEP